VAYHWFSNREEEPVASALLHVRLLAIVFCVIAFAACDDNDNFAPTSPTRPRFTNRLSGPPSIGSVSSGAVITGRVTGTNFNQSTQSAVTAPRVGIAPPGISTVVGADGNFTLTGVPPGSVTLVFTEDGVSAGILLTNVGVNQLIVLDVRVDNGVATIASDHRRSR
jgi:hypothetical protein